MGADPSIPSHRKGGRTAIAPTYGWFVAYGDTVVLKGARGDSWPLAWVTIAQGGWGWDDEGISKLPRPAVYDETGTVELVPGDRVLIEFLDGSPRRPVVTGGFRSVKTTDFLPYNHAAAGANPNRFAARLVPLNASHAPAGRIDVEAAADDLGTLRVEATERLTFGVRANLDAEAATGARAVLDKTELVVSAVPAQAVALVQATPYLANEAAAMTQIAAGLAVFGIPVDQVTSFISKLVAQYRTGMLRSQ